MNLFKLLLFLAGATVSLASCNSSKIAYGNSYYFKQEPKPVESSIEPVSTIQFVASNEDAIVPQIPSVHSPLPDKLAQIAHDYEQTQKQLEKTDLTRIQKKELKQEKRALRKQFKQELKELPHPENKAAVADEVTGLLKAGIIVGAAGVVMLGIGLLATVPFLTSLGGIFLAVGVVLILIKIL